MNNAIARNDLAVVDRRSFFGNVIVQFIGIPGEIPGLLELGCLAAARLEREVGAAVAQRPHRRSELDAAECP